MKILQISYKHAIACSIACFLAILPVYSQEYINVVAGSNFYNYYAYNSNGALTRDDSRGIMMIQYDNMNYPQTIQFFNGIQTEYTYSVSGEKLCTIHRTAVPNITVPVGQIHNLSDNEILFTDRTDYLFDGTVTLRNNVLDKILFDGGYCQASASQTSAGVCYTVSDHYYTSDHLGNVRIVQNQYGDHEQVLSYYPSGTQITEENVFSNYLEDYDAELQPYRYNGKELDRMHGLDWYDYGARYYDPLIMLWTSMDPFAEKYYHVPPYAYCMENPVRFIDPDGRKTVLFATKLPGNTSGSNFWLHTVAGSATHTFIAVFDNKTNALRGYFAFGPKEGIISGPLEKMSMQIGHKKYMQDLEIINEYRAGTAENDDRCKSAWSIETIDPFEQDKFDDKVIKIGNSYEPISTTKYNIAPSESNGTVNCNKGSFNLLKQAGVSDELLKAIGEKLPGRIWGWGQNMPWTQEEQYEDYTEGTWSK